MLRTVLLLTAGLAIAGPAAASDRCNQPYAPVIKADGSLTAQQVATLRGDVAAFIAASDIYQKCLSLKQDQGRIDANQAAKERIGREYNALVKSFKVARAN